MNKNNSHSGAVPKQQRGIVTRSQTIRNADTPTNPLRNNLHPVRHSPRRMSMNPSITLSDSNINFDIPLNDSITFALAAPSVVFTTIAVTQGTTTSTVTCFSNPIATSIIDERNNRSNVAQHMPTGNQLVDNFLNIAHANITNAASNILPADLITNPSQQQFISSNAPKMKQLDQHIKQVVDDALGSLIPSLIRESIENVIQPTKYLSSVNRDEIPYLSSRNGQRAYSCPRNNNADDYSNIDSRNSFDLDRPYFTDRFSHRRSIDSQSIRLDRWGLKFDGTANGMLVEDFVFRVEILKSNYKLFLE